VSLTSVLKAPSSISGKIEINSSFSHQLRGMDHSWFEAQTKKYFVCTVKTVLLCVAVRPESCVVLGLLFKCKKGPNFASRFYLFI